MRQITIEGHGLAHAGLFYWGEDMRLSPVGLDFIKRFETWVPWVYDDKVPAQRRGNSLVYREWHPGDPVIGTLTIGYGHTDAAKFDLGFKLRDVPPGFRLSEAQAAGILDVDLDECEQDVHRAVKVPLTQGQFDALVSFCFNCGPGNLRNLTARLNRGDYDACRKAFDLYVYSGGERTRGLQRRRDGEQELWDSRTPTAPEEPVDHPEAVDVVTAPPASMAQSSEGNAAVATGVGGGTTTAVLVSTAVKNAAGAKTITWTGFLVALAEQPEFWLALGTALLLVGGPAYIWFRRASELKLGVR